MAVQRFMVGVLLSRNSKETTRFSSLSLVGWKVRERDKLFELPCFKCEWPRDLLIFWIEFVGSIIIIWLILYLMLISLYLDFIKYYTDLKITKDENSVNRGKYFLLFYLFFFAQNEHFLSRLKKKRWAWGVFLSACSRIRWKGYWRKLSFGWLSTCTLVPDADDDFHLGMDLKTLMKTEKVIPTLVGHLWIYHC